MKKLIILVVLLQISPFLWAQTGGKAVFERVHHDFGEVKEEGGTVDAIFKFENAGADPLELLIVKASCGCTTPMWTQSAIPPGNTGYVKAVFNPANRPGKFNKEIRVTTSGSQMFTLTISGTVKPRPKGPRDKYPFESGNLRFQTNHFAFGKIKDSDKNAISTVVYNQGKDPIRFSKRETELPNHLTVRMSASEVQPGKIVWMSVTYDAPRKEDYGFVFEYFQLATSDPLEPYKRVNVSADIHQDFSKMSDGDLERAPKAIFDRNTYEFGEMKRGREFTARFILTNSGQRDLLIRKISAHCECITAFAGRGRLKPGTNTEILVKFHSHTETGRQNRTITVITNDPRSPISELKVSGVLPD